MKDHFYQAMSSYVRKQACEASGLGPAMAHSCGAGDAAAIVPTHIVFVIFADWGVKDLRGASPAARAAALTPYYIWKATASVLQQRLLAGVAGADVPSGGAPISTTVASAASPLATPAPAPGSSAGDALPAFLAAANASGALSAYLSDIAFAGGSRSTFIGSVPRSQYAALLLPDSGAAHAFACCTSCGARLASASATTLAPASGGAAPIASVSACDASGAGAGASAGAGAGRMHFDQELLALLRPPSVGVGLGLVTQEAFLHPEVPGAL